MRKFLCVSELSTNVSAAQQSTKRIVESKTCAWIFGYLRWSMDTLSSSIAAHGVLLPQSNSSFMLFSMFTEHPSYIYEVVSVIRELCDLICSCQRNQFFMNCLFFRFMRSPVSFLLPLAHWPSSVFCSCFLRRWRYRQQKDSLTEVCHR